MLLIQLQSVQERLRLFNNPTTAIEVPEEETLKTTTSPVQTATGKDLTNPLRADALLKSINKDNTGLSSSLSLNSKLVYPSPSTFGKSKMTNLATNPLMQEPVFKPDYLKAAKKEEERYYVVFKGPRSGIYTTWGETQKICQEDKSTNKKFRTLEQAQMELRLYGEAKKATPLLRPKINPLINKRREAARDQRFLKEEPIGLEPMVYFQEFVQLWNKARSACQQDFINERFYTTDKPTKSLYNFIEGSDPQLIYQAFRAGLIDNIYPSNNLLEIKEFHSSIFEAIKRFRKNVLKAQDKKIYIKVTSSIPDWNHEENYSPYHCMEIGLAKSNENLHFSKAMEDKSQNPFLEVIKSQRVQGLKRISEIILQAITEENRKVNYADSHCIVISYKNEAEKQDIQLLTQYGIPFLTNTIDAASTTKEAFCKHARQLFEEHSCIYCKDKNEEKEAGPSTSPKEPTSDEESS
ncbi:putative ribosomal protein L9/RNase H1 [Tanacetum coccineum]